MQTLGDVADAASPPVEGAPFVCGQTAPDTVVLVGLDGPLQTRFNDLAPIANGLCLRGLVKINAGAPEWEKQPGILVQTASMASPSHRNRLLHLRSWGNQRHVT